MYNLKSKESLLKAMQENVDANVKANLTDLKILEFMKNGNVELVKTCISKITANIISAIPKELAVPGVSVYTTCFGTEEIESLSITATNKIKSIKKFKYKFCSHAYEGLVEELVSFFLDIYIDLIVDDMMEENLNKVNSVLAEVAEKAGLGYEISITTPLGNEKKKISYLGDDGIVFVCDEERVFSLDDILAVQDVREFVTEEDLEKAKTQISDQLAEAQTPEQLVGMHGGILVSYICNINKHIKPMTLIKKVYNKNALKLIGNKDSYAYFSQDNIYAIVAKRDGNFEVVLSPFDVETLRKVDFDVVGAITAN